MKCMVCGRDFRRCESDYEWEDRYCSWDCFTGSVEYGDDRDRFLEFIDLLPPVSVAMLPSFIRVVTNSNYYSYFKEWLTEDLELGDEINNIFYGS